MPRKRDIEAAIAAYNDTDPDMLLPPEAAQLLVGLRRHRRQGRAADRYRGRQQLRWPGFMGQFGGFAKLGSGSRQAANLVSSSALVPIAPYASSGVRPFSPECGRRLL